MVNTTLPHLDRRNIREVETIAVDTILAAIPDREARLVRAGEIADEAQTIADRWRPQRDQAALSLALYDGHRGLNSVIGVTRTRFYDMRADALHLTKAEKKAKWLVKASRDQVVARARQHGVEHIPDAIKKLPRYANRVAAAKERDQAARAVRDRLVADLLRDGRTPSELGDLIGRNRSRVWQVIKKVDA